MKSRLALLGLVVVVAACGGKTEDAKEPTGDTKPGDTSGEASSGEKATLEAMGEAFIAACEGKAAGDACDAVFKDGDAEKPFKGKCVQPPAESKEQRVVCLPDELGN